MNVFVTFWHNKDVLQVLQPIYKTGDPSKAQMNLCISQYTF